MTEIDAEEFNKILTALDNEERWVEASKITKETPKAKTHLLREKGGGKLITLIVELGIHHVTIFDKNGDMTFEIDKKL